MNKKSLLGLILFSCVVISGMFLSTEILIEQSKITLQNQQAGINPIQEKELNTDSQEFVKNDSNENVLMTKEPIDQKASSTAPSQGINKSDNVKAIEEQSENFGFGDSSIFGESYAQVSPLPSKAAQENGENKTAEEKTTQGAEAENSNNSAVKDTVMASADRVFKPQLIYDYNKVDYQSHIPKIALDSELKSILDIDNPKINIQADAAILFDVKTNKVLYYKNPVKVEFPASTLKLLTAMVALNNCDPKEVVTIGDEINLIASDSTRAYLKKGEKISIKNLLEGMLLPSGNDAAYAIATYVGRKALKNPEATKEEAIAEFRRLMNKEAKKIGVKNSYFMTPDGYDAIGQYTTAYDMGLIGMAALSYKNIVEITQKTNCSTTFASGEEVTWTSTNKLLKRNSGEFYAPTYGLKTGTSNMAGKCLISAAKKDGKEVVCVIMHSDTNGRWEDSVKLMKYGLK